MPQQSTKTGDKYRTTHQASVDAILGSNVRTVPSRGGAFFCAPVSRTKRNAEKLPLTASPGRRGKAGTPVRPSASPRARVRASGGFPF